MALNLEVAPLPPGLPYYVFEMGDGTYATTLTNSFPYTYKNAGTYIITCYALDKFCRPGPKVTKTVTVSP